MPSNQQSFSMAIKDELIQNIPSARHCKIAEIAVIVACFGVISPQALTIRTENERIAQKYFTLLKKTFNINADAFEKKGFFEVIVSKEEDVLMILQAVRILNSVGLPQTSEGLVSEVLLKSGCCKRSFIKTAFLCLGSMSDPNKGNHLEFVCDKEGFANQIISNLAYFEIEARISIRKNKYFVVYLKDGDKLGDLLRVMETPVAIMEFENSVILREITNKTNRQRNCDYANTTKSVNTALKQIEDINYLNECIGISNLPATLAEVAVARLENPDVGLKELGELMTPPLGKSGVNHRLRKICEMAQKHRESNTK